MSIRTRRLFAELLEARDVPAANFQIVSLTADHVGTVTHGAVTGGDQGGIATSGSKVFVTGQTATGSFNLSNLSGGTSVGARYDALASNFRTGQAYVLGSRDFFPPFNINPLTTAGGQVTHLIPLDGGSGNDILLKQAA